MPLVGLVGKALQRPLKDRRATSAGATPRAGAIDRGACLSVFETWVPPQPRNPPSLAT